MNLTISEIPFSRRGSYFAISYLEKFNSIFIRDVHGGDESPSELFELILPDIDSSDCQSQAFKDNYVIDVTETLLTIRSLHHPEKSIRIILPTEDQLRIKVQGLSLKLKAHKVRYDTLNQLSETTFEYLSYKKESKYHLAFKGQQVTVTAPWYRVGNEHIEIQLAGENTPQELVITNYQVVPKSHLGVISDSFEDAHQGVLKDYHSWVERSLAVPTDYQKAHELATYILWSSIVRKEGQLTQESVYMSKNWMQNIWSWDNCFNAMGIGEANPELAYQQFLIFIDHQDPSGVYPDFINNQYVSYNCCKPPIHGWAYQQLMAKDDYFKQSERLTTIYTSLVASTNFWLEHRLDTQLQLPYYTHGNDSGWDNASVFHHGLPVVAPDLTAYLVQQMDILSRWAKELGRPTEARHWQELADMYTERLLKTLYDGEQFVARSSLTGEIIPEYQSLLLFLPLVIAYRLPPEITVQLTETITSQFEGAYGLSTEAKTSPHYQVDGYWLGPIWAPETYIFFDAFKRNGNEKIASRLAEKYCKVATLGGMAENYNPETGAGNDDLSFTWTSSVFLLLGNYLKKEQDDD